MADNRLPFQNPNTTDANLDTESLTVAGQTVHRERIQIAGTSDVAIASVSATSIPSTAFGLGVRPVGDFNVLATTTVTISNVLATTSGVARQTNPTAVADGVPPVQMFDDVGRQVMVPYHVRDLVTLSNVTIATTTETLWHGAAVNEFHDLIAIACTNTSGAVTRMDIRANTGGPVVFSVIATGTQTAGFMPPMPIPQTTSNNNWTIQLSANVTDVRAFGMWVRNV